MGRQRRVIDISNQRGFDFDAEYDHAEFTEPHYQRQLLGARTWAFATDLAIVFALFVLFVIATMSEMEGPIRLTRPVLGAYIAAYLVFVVAYLALFMISTGQTAGMRLQRLRVVNRRGRGLRPSESLWRAFGYLISVVPGMFGLIWALVDPEHLTWADKVSQTFVKRA